MSPLPGDGDGSVQSCPKCNTLVDVSEQEPLAKIHCPECGASMRVTQQFNHFTIIEALGNGGMGMVYKALDRNLNRMVALKLLRKELSADEDYIIKLEDEARITASINHPYVVKVFTFDQDRGQYYIAMELVDKGSLDELMQLQNRVAELQTLQVGIQVASGLQAAHERGLIHRDVKPGNILFSDAQTAKITDFGLALLAEHEAEARGEIWGTPYYIAPEKLNHEPEDFRSDIYSLGGTLFHAIAGRPPFEAESASLVALKHLKSRAVSLQAFAPEVSAETAYVINRMLNKDPAERYQSYEELIEHLQYAADTLTANLAKPRAPKERVVVEPESHRNVAGLLTLLLLVLVVVGGVLAFALRDRLFGDKSAAANPQTTVQTPLAAPKDTVGAEQLARAQRQIADGQLAAAQETLAALTKRKGVTPPLSVWGRMHQGFLALLNHQLAESRELFATVQKEGAFSDKEADSKLVNFFTETGRYLADDKPIPATVTKIWNKNTMENFSILLFGLKDWELGNFDNANKLLQEYLSGNPAGADLQWINGYASVARRRVDDYALYAPLRDRLKANPELPAARAALLADFTQARGKLAASGKLAEAFDQAETELKNTPAPTVASNANDSPANTSANSTAPGAEETRRWQTALGNYQQLARQYRFDQAAAALQNVQLQNATLAQERDQTQARAKRLIAFKQNIINDLQARGGYPQAVFTRRGATFQRGIQSATVDNVIGMGASGPITVSWTDFPPKTLLAAAVYLADKNPDPAQVAERHLVAAAFAAENGLSAEARALADKAAREQPALREEITQMFSVTPPTAQPKP